MRGGWLSIAAVSAGCGFTAPGSPGVADAGTDASGDPYQDAAGSGLDAAVPASCLGPTGTAWQVCLGDPGGLAEITLPAVLDTDESELCLDAQPSGWAPAQPAACFLVGSRVRVTSTRAVGERPLVLVGVNDVVIEGTLDVSSPRGQQRGAGSRLPGSCGAFARRPEADDVGEPAGGGAGGSFTTQGGPGGRASEDGDNLDGGLPGSAIASPPTLRGGCDGQAGGNNAQPPGRGGGAVYVVSGSSIHVAGTINASGGGADGTGNDGGGNGGGSGGMIVLHAPAISVGSLRANGGGGSAGGDNGNGSPGAPGGESQSSVVPAVGGAGPGGAGGNGYALGAQAGGGGNGVERGGGGGGGGAGYIRANLGLVGDISPAVEIIP